MCGRVLDGAGRGSRAESGGARPLGIYVSPGFRRASPAPDRAVAGRNIPRKPLQQRDVELQVTLIITTKLLIIHLYRYVVDVITEMAS